MASPECNCESMGGRFGAHRPECPWQIAFEEDLAAEKRTAEALPPCPYCGHHTLFRPEGWTPGYPVECANPFCETNTADPVSD